MGKEFILSKQQLKSKETKDRIFQAAKSILKQHGYEHLSIKNICEKAGVSNGSFYHHFKTKDDLLSYYIEDQPDMDSSLLIEPKTPEEVRESIIQVYLNYVSYCETLGIEFMSSYYTPKNQALHPTTRTKRPYPILTVQGYIENAVTSKVLRDTLPIESIITDIRILVIGNVFEWCLKQGDVDFKRNMQRSLHTYLNGAFSISS